MAESAAEQIARIHKESRESSVRAECGIGRMLDGLAPDMRDAMMALINDEREEHNHLTRTLAEVAGKKLGNTTMGRHRRGECLTCRWPVPNPIRFRRMLSE